MSSEAELNTLTARFNTQFSASQPTVSIAWPNIEFTPTTGSPWVRFSLRSADASQVGFGSSAVRDRFLGTVFVQVFTPIDQGASPALQIADDAAAALRRYSTTGLFTRTPLIQAIGPTGDGWYQVNVSVPYQRDEDF
jgi:hypothetical protein